MLLMNVLAPLVGAIPEGFVLLLGLGAAAWLFGRSRAAGIALGIGVVLLALYLLFTIVVMPVLLYLVQTQVLTGAAQAITFSAAQLLLAAIHGLGIVAILAAICAGPAPDRYEVES